jgi:hypothetical protein
MTLKRVTILSARRAFEFPVDGIRLSMLCTDALIAELRAAFHFQGVAVVSPPNVFGEVPPTTPPGLVCQIGDVKLPDGAIVPIRALWFDASRMVIDIAGPSDHIDFVRDRIYEVASRYSAPDGQPVLAKPFAASDQSDITFKAELPLELGLNSRVVSTIGKYRQERLVSSMLVRVNPGDLFLASPPATFIIEPRSGTRLDDHLWFSTAPLETARHSAYLDELMPVLIPDTEKV